MKNSDVIIAHPNSQDKLHALTEFMNANHIPFELAILDSPYKKEFVDNIIHGDEDKKNSIGRRITMLELDLLLK